MNFSFICTGFPKTATTSIDAILRQHPDICLPCQKETLFFRDYHVKGHTRDWYERRYFGRREQRANNKIYGEINPQSMYYGNRERKILREFGPNTKFIYSLRNPADSVFSLFRYYALIGTVFEGWFEYGCEKAFDIYLDKYLDQYNRETFEQHMRISIHLMGRYIATALKNVPREQMLFIDFEDYIHDPTNEIRKILEFIGARTDVELNCQIKANDGNRLPISLEESKKVARKVRFWWEFYVEKMPYLGRTIERKMDEWYWNIPIKHSVPVQEKIKMSDDARTRLNKFFYKDVKLLDEVLETNYLVKWNIKK